ncbi:MAG: hypothetical protein HY275_16780 [Gemmatimonadetes bacterium]|nr:hypothetical protein [Gemmatimonadota bacterium]
MDKPLYGFVERAASALLALLATLFAVLMLYGALTDARYRDWPSMAGLASMAGCAAIFGNLAITGRNWRWLEAPAFSTRLTPLDDDEPPPANESGRDRTDRAG